MSQIGAMGPAGWGTLRQSVERELFAGAAGYERHLIYDHAAVIEKETVDARNSPTTDLSAGLVLAHDGNGNYREYDPDNTTNLWQREAAAILPYDFRIPDLDGTNTDRHVAVIVAGAVDAASLGGLDQAARAQLSNRFAIFESSGGLSSSFLPFTRTIPKGADYTVVAADQNHEFHATAAANFTLPAIANGLRFRFLNTADSNMTVTSAEGDNMIAFNDAAADSVAFSTVGEKIGGYVEVCASYISGTLKWVVANLSPGAHTITVAT